MKTEKIYIGVRETNYDDEHRAANRTLIDLRVLNEGLSKSVRQGAMDKGITQSIKGRKIKIYVGNEETIQTLESQTPNVVLFRVNGEDLDNGLQEHNGKFPRRMDKETYKNYQNGLKDLFSNLVQVVYNDKDDHKKPAPTKDVFKVGDWVPTPSKFRRMTNIVSEMCRVYRVSASSYWVEIPFMTDYPKGVACGKFARRNYEGVNGVINESNYQADEDWTIPYEQNKDVMDFQQMDSPFRFPNASSYKSRVETDPNKQGFHHTYTFY